MGIPVEQIPPSKQKQKELPPHLDDDVSLQLPCPNDSQQPLTVFVRHHVLRNKQAEFIHWCNEINAMARTYEGFISTEVIKPVCYDGNSSNKTDIAADTSNSSRRGRRNSSSDYSGSGNFHPNKISDEYISIVRFQNYTLLKRWIDSEDRKTMLRLTNEFSNVQSTYSYHSLEHWFPSNINGTNTSTTGANPLKKHGPPPKWKMVIVVTTVIYIQTLWIPKVTKAIFPKAYDNPNVKTYAMGLFNTLLVVSLVTYILFPITTRLLAFWLFPHENYYDKLKELIPKSNILSDIMTRFHHKSDRQQATLPSPPIK